MPRPRNYRLSKQQRRFGLAIDAHDRARRELQAVRLSHVRPEGQLTFEHYLARLARLGDPRQTRIESLINRKRWPHG